MADSGRIKPQVLPMRQRAGDMISKNFPLLRWLLLVVVLFPFASLLSHMSWAETSSAPSPAPAQPNTALTSKILELNERIKQLESENREAKTVSEPAAATASSSMVRSTPSVESSTPIKQSIPAPRPTPKPAPSAAPKAAKSPKEVKANDAFYNKYQQEVLKDRKPFALDKGFLEPAIQHYKGLGLGDGIWLDGGAGQCGTLQYMLGKGLNAVGVELSDPSKTACRKLVGTGRIHQGPLHDIPYPDRHFDLVWSSEVFEHVPMALVPASVQEMVRVAKKHMFLSIAMKRSGFDPDPPAKPKIHITVMPRKWWDAIFSVYGCKVDWPVRTEFLKQKYPKATFFPYICHEDDAPVIPDECLPAIEEMGVCMVKYGDANVKCNPQRLRYEEICGVK